MDEQYYTEFIVDDTVYETTLTPNYQRRRKYERANPKKVICLIPGIIRAINIAKGTKVKMGDTLLVLEAMKMQNSILAPLDGKIKAVLVTKNQMATKGQVLVEYE